MNYHCPNCAFGHMKLTKSTYTRQMGKLVVMLPNFPTWCCDCCGHTLYDATALKRLDMLLGPDPETWDHSPRQARLQNVEGPGESGPGRWST